MRLESHVKSSLSHSSQTLWACPMNALKPGPIQLLDVNLEPLSQPGKMVAYSSSIFFMHTHKFMFENILYFCLKPLLAGTHPTG